MGIMVYAISLETSEFFGLGTVKGLDLCVWFDGGDYEDAVSSEYGIWC